MSADFRIVEDDGQMILSPQSTRGHNALRKANGASVILSATLSTIRELGELGFTFEGDLPHDK